MADQPTKVLVTGGTGFIALHILDQLLEQGYEVVATVRDSDKSAKLLEAYKSHPKLSTAIVPDIAQEGAFDQVVAQTPNILVVLHTASPVRFDITDPKKDLIDPAVIGTTSILKAVHASAPSVRRVVITSSLSAILDETRLADPTACFSEASWNPVTLAEIGRSPATAYRASKTLAERAAWDFVARESPAFDLVAINPPNVFGPLAHPSLVPRGLAGINFSNQRAADLLLGKWRERVPDTKIVQLWVDVRDVARAHIRAIPPALRRPDGTRDEVGDLGGQRLFTVAGMYALREFAAIVRREFPELAKELLPLDPAAPGGELPEPHYQWDNSQTNAAVKIEWIPLEKTAVDMINSLRELQKQQQA